MGAVLREQNALPYEAWIMKNLTAKDDVDNVGAGRAAKGANPVASTKKYRKLLEFPAFFISILIIYCEVFKFGIYTFCKGIITL